MMAVLLAALLLLGLGAGVLWRKWQQSEARRRRAEAAHAEALRRTQRLSRVEAIAEERERIYSDLHDDIGAKLLDLVYRAETPDTADLARAVLQDLRDVVSRARGAPGTLGQILGEIRAEAAGRLEAVGVHLLWESDPALPDPMLDHGHALHLYRIVREAMTNALRHAHPTRIRIRAFAERGLLLLDVTDDGHAAAAAPAAGRGTQSMRHRAQALQGSISWDPGTEGGTKVVLRMPLPEPEPELGLKPGPGLGPGP